MITQTKLHEKRWSREYARRKIHEDIKRHGPQKYRAKAGHRDEPVYIATVAAPKLDTRPKLVKAITRMLGYITRRRG